MIELQLDQLFTYHLITADSEDEKDLSEMLYKIQLLQLFGLNELDETVMNEKMNSLYETIKEESFITELLQENSYKHSFFNSELLFRTLFSYDYLDLFHRCLYNHFNNLPMEDSLNKLKIEITSK